MGNLDFDAENEDPRDPFELIPINTRVRARVHNTDLKPTNAGDGHYLAVELVIVDGPHEGRHLFENLNIDNPSEKAEAIGRGKLAQLVLACGLVKVSDHEELRDRAVDVVVGIEPARGEYEARNKIKKYVAPGGDDSAAPQPAAEGKPPAKASGAAPWGKR